MISIYEPLSDTYLLGDGLHWYWLEVMLRIEKEGDESGFRLESSSFSSISSLNFP